VNLIHFQVFILFFIFIVLSEPPFVPFDRNWRLAIIQGFIRIRAKVLFFVEKFSRELIFTLELEV